MSHDNIEIEIRIALDSDSFLQLAERVANSGRPKSSRRQVDEYFTPSHRNFVAPEFPFEWLSIRERDGTFILNYKHFHPENVPVTDYCDEFEVRTQNGHELRNILSALDFSSLVTVEKKRDTYVCDDEFEVSFDTVKDLGYFVEIEVLKDFGSIEVAREKLIKFAEGLGIDASKNDNRGYPFLLMAKRGLI